MWVRDVAAGRSPRLMLEMPPQHGKSTISSVCGPAWILGHHPDWPLILGSYGQDLSRTHSRGCRSIMREPWYEQTFPRAKMAADQASVDDWGTTAGGGYKAVGVGSAVTGQPARAIVLDDTTKNRAEAYSKVQRDRAWGWYEWDVESRLAPGGGVLVLQTRWHHDDVPGRLQKRDGLASDGGQWKIISLPAIAEEDEFLDGELWRPKGQALHPERYPANCAKFVNAQKNPALWNALYQQRPTSRDGDIFKRQFFDRIVPRSQMPSLRWYRLWDWAGSSADTADRTASAAVAFDDLGNLWIRDMVKGRWDYPESKKVFKQVALAPHEQGVSHGIEALLSWKIVADDLMADIELAGVPIAPVRYPPGAKDKISRALPWADRAAAGKVILVEGEWIPDFIDECVAFPAGKHDDQIDTVSGGVMMLSQGAWEEWEW